MPLRSLQRAKKLFILVLAFLLLKGNIFDVRAEQYRRGSRFPRAATPAPRALFLIADVHCRYEVQRNIADILARLQSRAGVKTVFLEGAWQGLDFSFYASLPDQALRKELLDHFMGRGLISGAESFAIQSAAAVCLSGMESRGLYEESLRLLKGALRNQPPPSKTKEMQALLDAWEERGLNQDLLSFLRSPQEDMLAAWAQKTRAYPALLNYFDSPSSQTHDPLALYEEAQRLRWRIEESLAESAGQKQPLLAARHLRLLCRLTAAQMTRIEWEEFRRRPIPMARLPPALRSFVEELRPLQETMETFYTLAADRDEAMANALAKNLPPGSSAAVAGGFHALSLQRLLQRRGIDCRLRVPAGIGPQGADMYREILKNGPQALAPPSFLESPGLRRQFMTAAAQRVWSRVQGSSQARFQALSDFKIAWETAYREKTGREFPLSWEAAEPDEARVSLSQPGARSVKILSLTQWLSGVSFYSLFYVIYLLGAGYDISQLAQIFACFSPLYILGSLIMGQAAAIYGKRDVLRWSLALNAAGTCLLPLAALSPAALMLSQAAVAFGLAGYSVSFSGLLYESLQRIGRAGAFKTVYGASMQRFWLAMSVSAGLGGWLAGFLPAWFLIILTGAVYLGQVFLAGRLPRTAEKTGALSLAAAVLSIKSWVPLHGNLLKTVFQDKALGRFVLLALAANGLFLAGVDFLAQPLMDGAGVPLSLFGLFYLGFNAAQSLGARESRRWEGLVLQTGQRTAYFFLMLGVLAVLLWEGSAWVAVLILFLANFWQGLLSVVGPGHIHSRLSDEDRARWFSLWNIINAAVTSAGMMLLSVGLAWLPAAAALGAFLGVTILASIWAAPGR